MASAVNLTFLASILGVLALLVLVCLTQVSALWRIDFGVDDDADRAKDDLWGLARSVKKLRDATREGEHAMDPEDALLLVIRIRASLTAGILGLAALALVCGTVITCVYVSKR
jgi:hypothetical protein